MIFFGLCMIAIIIYSIIITKKQLENTKNVMEQKLKLQNMNTKYKLNKDMSIVTNDLRALRHDMNNHLSVINGLLNTNQIDALKSYLNGLLKEVAVANDFIVSDNEILSIILNNKKAIAKSKNIEFDCTLLTNFDGLSETEVCSLFGNLLDNAIDAADKVVDRRYVEMQILFSNNKYEITCRNAYAKRPLLKNGRPITTKQDKNLHGIGTKNIYDIIQKYSGNVQYYFYEGECVVKIYLPRN